MTLLLGIDLSTTGAKALLIDPEGRVAGSATTPLSLSSPHPLWSEQEPQSGGRRPLTASLKCLPKRMVRRSPLRLRRI